MRRFSLRKHRGRALLSAWKSLHSALRIRDRAASDTQDLCSSSSSSDDFSPEDNTTEQAPAVLRRAVPPLPLHAKNMRKYPPASFSEGQEPNGDSERPRQVQGLLSPTPGNMTLVRLQCAEAKLLRKSQEALARLLRRSQGRRELDERAAGETEHQREKMRGKKAKARSEEISREDGGVESELEAKSEREARVADTNGSVQAALPTRKSDEGRLEAVHWTRGEEESRVRTEELRSYLRYAICTFHHLELETLFSLFCQKHIDSFSAHQLQELHALLFFSPAEESRDRGENGAAQSPFSDGAEPQPHATDTEQTAACEGKEDAPNDLQEPADETSEDTEETLEEKNERKRRERKAEKKASRNAFLCSLLNGTARAVPPALRDNQVLALLLHYLHTEHPLLPQMNRLPSNIEKGISQPAPQLW
ncbi:conserved hypothetical protein [Neospora caninum Liverpool]|nr:conserved hypothetical protein [Neospora caninum Liverpool]CBZ50021.1 conserved hypothetical protein [Neospora caninum Liverpool]|eukprot:XP_003880056.1 conserved hypothetical protein [Neospora caninum Liverpool]